MKIIRCCIFILVLFIFLRPCYGQCYLKIAGIDTLITSAIDLFHQEAYFDALSICHHIMDQYPENPMGYLGAAVVYHGIMRGYWINSYESVYDSLLTIAVTKGDAAIKKNKEEAECYFVYGAALGIRGLHRIRKGLWLGAFWDGLKGYQNVKKAYAMDSSLVDACFGLGLFYYWKSAKAKKLPFLRLMKDEREKGIDYITIAVEKGKFSTMEGHFYLLQIYYFENRIEDAYRECLALQPKFADHPLWLYLIANVLEKKGQWADSRYYFQKLVAKLEKSPFTISNGLLADCHFHIACNAFRLHESKIAQQECETALNYGKKHSTKYELEGPLESFEVTLEKMEKLNAQLNKIVH